VSALPLPAGLGTALVLGLAHAGLSLWLWAGGEAPSFARGPLGAATWYRDQAALLPVLHPVAALAFAEAAARVAGVPERRPALRTAWARALLLGLVAVDVVAYGVGGAEMLREAAPLVGCLTLLFAYQFSARVLKDAQVGPAAGLTAMVAGLAAAGLVLAPWVR
jgi:hypothetical protein